MTHTDLPDIADAAEPLRWLARCPAHAATPLVAMTALAHARGWAVLHAKDETGRMGLGSFKSLGGAYAVARLVAERVGAGPDDLATHHGAGVTLCCASAGNHGLSVAAGARLFGATAEVHLAASVPEGFADRLRAMGARVVRSGAIYEEAMAAAVARAADPGVILVSDASWQGEMRVPSLVMQGYAVMAEEIRTEFAASGQWPTHVALQAGVGGLTATVAVHIRRTWPAQPHIVVVEPDRAPCLRESVTAGRPVRVDGPVSTMGRLDCKEPSLRAFEVLRDADVEFVAISDAEAEAAASNLAANGLATTPSGAAGLAGLAAAGLPPEARSLILVTERAE